MKGMPVAAVLAIVLTVRSLGVAGFAPPASILNYPAKIPLEATIKGFVTNIDPVNRLLQVKDKDGIIQSIRVDDEVQILRNGEPAPFNDVSLGDQIIVMRK